MARATMNADIPDDLALRLCELDAFRASWHHEMKHKEEIQRRKKKWRQLGVAVILRKFPPELRNKIFGYYLDDHFTDNPERWDIHYQSHYVLDQTVLHKQGIEDYEDSPLEINLKSANKQLYQELRSLRISSSTLVLWPGRGLDPSYVDLSKIAENDGMLTEEYLPVSYPKASCIPREVLAGVRHVKLQTTIFSEIAHDSNPLAATEYLTRTEALKILGAALANFAQETSEMPCILSKLTLDIQIPKQRYSLHRLLQLGKHRIPNKMSQFKDLWPGVKMVLEKRGVRELEVRIAEDGGPQGARPNAYLPHAVVMVTSTLKLTEGAILKEMREKFVGVLEEREAHIEIDGVLKAIWLWKGDGKYGKLLKPK